MTYRIAISGKGGVGKSTAAALIVRYLAEKLHKPVLAVDADPNATLGPMLGVEVQQAVSDIREETLEKKDAIPAGMSKDRFVEFRVQQCIEECTGFDLLTMGRPEGPGCYCFVNNLLRRYLERTAEDYPYVVIDNEAGMEHLSRRTNSAIDLLLVITEPTILGIDTAARISRMADELPIAVKRSAVVLNRVAPTGVSPEARQRIEDAGLEVTGEIPLDDEVMARSMTHASLRELPEENDVFAAVKDILIRELKLPIPVR
jgi:CO dehydrogenase maturation factor